MLGVVGDSVAIVIDGKVGGTVGVVGVVGGGSVVGRGAKYK